MTPGLFVNSTLFSHFVPVCFEVGIQETLPPEYNSINAILTAPSGGAETVAHHRSKQSKLRVGFSRCATSKRK